ncbi:hypothetical protein, partial [Flavobacterium silvaticum]|uniref:hypothetical protein n=1 Tax=Flavobacterium silvaticum TaxID=1852020 RepID=UPI001B7D0785
AAKQDCSYSIHCTNFFLNFHRGSRGNFLQKPQPRLAAKRYQQAAHVQLFGRLSARSKVACSLHLILGYKLCSDQSASRLKIEIFSKVEPIRFRRNISVILSFIPPRQKSQFSSANLERSQLVTAPKTRLLLSGN